MNRHRHRSKTAVVSLICALLTTPLTTLGALQLADHPGNPVWQFLNSIPYFGRATLVAFVVIAPPLCTALLASLALRKVSSSWTPMTGSGYAKLALLISILSTLAAIALFSAGILQNAA